ncbi:MAG: MoxR family ATPase [Deltaproteobacteria bacterium]|nr:MoxR family ATPase [Deltaproteobacteria bacterium]
MKRDKDLEVPKPEKHFFLKRDVVENLDRIAALAKRHPVNVLVAGKQGCGKSTLVRQFAARNKRPFATFQIGILSEPGQLFGEHRLRKGETYYQQFLFPRAVQTPRCVIHLEEINRPEHPKALNMLFSVLSENRTVWLDELGLIKVADEVIFFATLNEGDEFIGTEMLDAALRDRFYVNVLEYLPPEVETTVLRLKADIGEAEALTIVNVANRLRSNAQEPMVVSTRHTLMIAELVNLGAPVKEAFINSLQMSHDVLESILLSLHVELGLREKDAGKGYEEY